MPALSLNVIADAYLDPWIISARSLVIFPDSTVPIHAASSFSVKSNSLALLSNFALLTITNSDPHQCLLIIKQIDKASHASSRNKT